MGQTSAEGQPQSLIAHPLTKLDEFLHSALGGNHDKGFCITESITRTLLNSSHSCKLFHLWIIILLQLFIDEPSFVFGRTPDRSFSRFNLTDLLDDCTLRTIAICFFHIYDISF